MFWTASNLVLTWAFIPLYYHLSYFENHSSCRLDPSFISSYISSEVAAGRYFGPYSPPLLESLIGPFMTSPLGLVPKPHSSKFRMIQDLSFPRNHPSISSINSFINSDSFPTAWGTFSATRELILSLPPGCVAATFDISAAYRITPVRPSQQNFTCISWKGGVYVDRAACFGLSSSAGVTIFPSLYGLYFPLPRDPITCTAAFIFSFLFCTLVTHSDLFSSFPFYA